MVWFGLVWFGGILPLLFILHYSSRHAIFIYTTRRVGTVPACCPHGFRLVEGLLLGAEPWFEVAPDIQQAEAPLSEPRPTLIAKKSIV
jgi:hypothetical protein